MSSSFGFADAVESATGAGGIGGGTSARFEALRHA
jgi:hypothetical protein